MLVFDFFNFFFCIALHGYRGMGSTVWNGHWNKREQRDYCLWAFSMFFSHQWSTQIISICDITNTVLNDVFGFATARWCWFIYCISGRVHDFERPLSCWPYRWGVEVTDARKCVSIWSNMSDSELYRTYVFFLFVLRY